MGFYLEQNSQGERLLSRNKADQLLDDGAEEIYTSEDNLVWQPNLVCVVSNGVFDAAGWAYNRREMEAFKATPHDQRPRRWLIVPELRKIMGKTYDNVLTEYSDDD